MTQATRELRPDELAELIGDPDDPDLDGLLVAIYLEDALDVVIPPSMLDWAHLGTLSGVRATLGSSEG